MPAVPQPIPQNAMGGGVPPAGPMGGVPQHQLPSQIMNRAGTGEWSMVPLRGKGGRSLPRPQQQQQPMMAAGPPQPMPQGPAPRPLPVAPPPPDFIPAGPAPGAQTTPLPPGPPPSQLGGGIFKPPPRDQLAAAMTGA